MGMVLVTTLFFMWGFITTALNDILIPHLKAFFALSYTQAMLVQSSSVFSRPILSCHCLAVTWSAKLATKTV
jgi:fucose permease